MTKKIVNLILEELAYAKKAHPWPDDMDLVHSVAIMAEEAGEATREANCA